MKTEKQKTQRQSHTKSKDRPTVKSSLREMDSSINEHEKEILLREVEEALRELNALKEHLMVGR